MKENVYLDDLDDGISRITLNSPSTLNAMDDAMASEFKTLIEELRLRKDLRVLILSGEGRAFSAGGHVSMLSSKLELGFEENKAAMLAFYESFLCIRHLEVPSIAAINGHAIGAGLCLALACDIRYVVPEAKLGLNFVQIGLHPGMGATYFVPKLVGPGVAAELMFAGSIFSGEDAMTLGLVNSVFEKQDFENSVLGNAQKLATSAPESVRQLKNTFSKKAEAELLSCLEREAHCQAENFQGKEFREFFL